MTDPKITFQPNKENLPKPEVRENQKREYLQLIDHFGMPKNIYYPGVGTDITPAEVFTESKITFLKFSKRVSKSPITCKPFNGSP